MTSRSGNFFGSALDGFARYSERLLAALRMTENSLLRLRLLLLLHADFEAIHITGDTTGRAYRHEKAKRLLNWEPLEGR